MAQQTAPQTARQPQQQRQQPRAKPQQPASSSKPRRAWKEAVDPKSGRTYYYDAATRETQWRKPLELASVEERRAIQAKERKQKDFFSEMEANILRCMQSGKIPGPADADDSFESDDAAAGGKMQPASPLSRTSIEKTGGVSVKKKGKGLLPKSAKPKGNVRTISMMGENTITELVGGNKSKAKTTGTKSASPNSVAAFPVTSSVPTKLGGPLGATPMVSHGFHTTAAAATGGGAQQHRRTGSDDSQDRAIEQIRRVADEMARSSGEWAPLVGDDLINSAHSQGSAASSGENSVGALVPPPKVGDLKSLARPTLANRNTCGTIHVGSTMSVPDKDATIKCVCGVFRAHMLQAAKDEASTGFRPPVRFDEYEIFNDRPSDRRSTSNASPPRSKKTEGWGSRISSSTTSGPFVVSSQTQDLQNGIEALSLESVDSAVPSLDAITAFYRDVFRRSQMETDCIIMSLIYVERLIKDTNGGVRPRVGNWRSILFASMVMSSKVWDDLSMWNADFSQACPAGVRFTLRRINELELAMLGCLKFSVKVPASEYAKYYFLLRSMMIRSGLAGDDLSSMTPLDVEGARKLEVMSSKFRPEGEGEKLKAASLTALRSRSVGEVEEMIGPDRRASTSPKGLERVNLEHVMHL